MGQITDDHTPVILKKLLILVPGYYAGYYLSCLIACAIAGVDFSFGIPFDFAAFDDFSFGDGAKLAPWLAMVLSMVPCCMLLVFFVAKSVKMAMDYAVTLATLHLAVSVLVHGFGSAPTAWVWWLTLVASSLAAGTGAEVMTYKLVDLKDIDTGRGDGP